MTYPLKPSYGLLSTTLYHPYILSSHGAPESTFSSNYSSRNIHDSHRKFHDSHCEFPKAFEKYQRNFQMIL